jgi:hypothetical protein
MAIQRTKNVIKAFFQHLRGHHGFRSDYFWVLLNGGRHRYTRASLPIWDVNHPDWDTRSPLAYDGGYEEFDLVEV